MRFLPALFDAVRAGSGRSESSGQLALLWLLTAASAEDMPIDTAVRSLAAGERGKWREQLEDFATLLRRGTPLHDAIGMVAGLLPDETILAARVGAAAGTLPESLRAEAKRMSRKARHADGSWAGTIIYLSTVIALIALLLIAFALRVLPRFRNLFDSFKISLPPSTATLLSAFDSPWTLPLLISILSLPLSLLLWTFGVRYRWLNPRRLFPRLEMPFVLSQLGVVVRANRPLIDGMHILSSQHSNPTMWKRLSKVYESLRSGEDCWELMQSHGLLRPREQRLLKSAERVGNLGWALGLVSEQVESRHRNRLGSLAQVVQPTAIILVGIFACFIAIALFAPLLQLIEGVAK